MEPVVTAGLGVPWANAIAAKASSSSHCIDSTTTMEVPTVQCLEDDAFASKTFAHRTLPPQPVTVASNGSYEDSIPADLTL